MKTPTYLENKQHVIRLQGNEIINQSGFEMDGDIIYLSGKETVFLYLEDYLHQSLHLEIEKTSDLIVYIIYKSSISTDYRLSVNIRETAKLDVFTAVRNIEKTTVKIDREFHVEQNAVLEMSTALLNMGETYLVDNVHLDQEYAKVKIDILNIGSFNDRYQVSQDVHHNAKHTESNINNSLISNSNAKLSYSVSGRIFKGNEFSICKQSNKGIILSDAGEIEVVPRLFIDEYNVEASHGAAIGQIDEEQLYYLLSRGLTETEARSLIISGYTKPFLNKIGDEDIKLLIERQILKRMNEANII